MGKKYENSLTAFEWTRRLFDLLVSIQEEQGVSNQTFCNLSGIGMTPQQLPNITGVRRSDYRGDRQYTGQRDQCDLATFYDLCKALDVEPSEVILRAEGFDKSTARHIVKLPHDEFKYKYIGESSFGSVERRKKNTKSNTDLGE